MRTLSLAEARLEASLDRLVTAVLAAQHDADLQRRRAVLEHAILRSQDLWGRFWREACLLSATGAARDAAGQKVARAPGCRTFQIAHTKIRAYYRKLNHPNPHWEPDWHKPAVVAEITRLLQSSNANTLSSAVSAQQNPYQELRLVRNYIAHMGASAARDAYSVSGGSAPHEYILQPVRGVTRFEEWVGRMKLVASAAVI